MSNTAIYIVLSMGKTRKLYETHSKTKSKIKTQKGNEMKWSGANEECCSAPEMSLLIVENIGMRENFRDFFLVAFSLLVYGMSVPIHSFS